MDQVSPGLVGMDYYTNGGDAALRKVVAIDISQDRTVVLADPTDENKMPAIGFVFAISGAKVFVKASGDMDQFSGLTRGDLYWADPDNPGEITSTPPEVSGYPGGVIIQVVAQASAADRLHVMPDGFGIIQRDG
jgi:hypothetical protein